MRKGYAYAVIVGLAIAASTETFAADMDPKICLTLSISPKELEELHDVVSRFAEQEHFVVREFGPNELKKDHRPIFLMELERDKAVQFILLNVDREDKILIFCYQLKSDEEFEKETSRFEDVLKKRWPNIVPYKGFDVGPFKNL